jgi:hypothetical protein
MEQSASGLSKEQEMFGLIAEHENSELSIKDFCELYDMAQGTYYYWQKKYHANQEVVKEKPIGFSIVEVGGDRSEVEGAGLFAEYKGIRFYREPSVSFLKALIS